MHTPVPSVACSLRDRMEAAASPPSADEVEGMPGWLVEAAMQLQVDTGMLPGAVGVEVEAALRRREAARRLQVAWRRWAVKARRGLAARLAEAEARILSLTRVGLVDRASRDAGMVIQQAAGAETVARSRGRGGRGGRGRGGRGLAIRGTAPAVLVATACTCAPRSSVGAQSAVRSHDRTPWRASRRASFVFSAGGDVPQAGVDREQRLACATEGCHGLMCLRWIRVGDAWQRARRLVVTESFSSESECPEDGGEAGGAAHLAVSRVRAATVLQCAARRRAARSHFCMLRLRDMVGCLSVMAVVVQCAVRRFVARREAERRRVRQSEIRCRLLMMHDTLLTYEAAVAMQCCWRRLVARRRVAQQRMLADARLGLCGGGGGQEAWRTFLALPDGTVASRDNDRALAAAHARWEARDERLRAKVRAWTRGQGLSDRERELLRYLLRGWRQKHAVRQE